MIAASTPAAHASEAHLIRRLVDGEGLEAHFQPIVSLQSCAPIGYEGLIRGPGTNSLRSPTTLFARARAAGLALELEIACAREVLTRFAALGAPGSLCVNLSGPSIERMGEHPEAALGFLLESSVPPAQVVIELTEHERVADPSALKRRVAALRRLGLQFALDDFGDGHSSLRLWAELAPEYVKVDKYFVRGVHSEPTRFQCVKALVQLGRVFGTQLIAEGVEAAEDLRVLRDLGIELAQGYFLGDPRLVPAREVPPAAVRLLQSEAIAVYPEVVKMPLHHATVGQLVVAAPALAPEATNNDAVAAFRARPQLHALAIVSDNRPIGILNRRHFMDRYAQPYYRELYGKRACTAFMNDRPLVVERDASLEALTGVLTGQDQRYLADGLIVTQGGSYIGLATGESLVRMVAEIRVEAARYANPLTFLPGNIPVSEHIARLLAARGEFTACYSDLNQFKPFNDQYGYWRGDEMIKLAARCIASACDPLRDFLGHVGGDDFVVLFQSTDWRERCARIIASFNAAAPVLFDAADRARGGIVGEDRQGREAFFPLTTLSIGAVRASGARFGRHEDVASAAAAAKREAKRRGCGLFELPGAPS